VELLFELNSSHGTTLVLWHTTLSLRNAANERLRCMSVK
jgi:predicted ABC-type transport system involved in lysophospholipase L1 biosynthesis ATPase subunit